MRRLVLASVLPVLCGCGALAPGASAQTGSQASLVLTVYGGAAIGGGLWDIAKQPFQDPSTGTYDTLRLTRDMGSSIAVGASFSYFPKRLLGFQGDIAYLGLPLEDRCQGVYYNNPDPTDQSVHLCNDIEGQSHPTGAVSFFASVIARAAPRRATSPYVRAGLGLVTYDHSTIEVSGSPGPGLTVRTVISDDNPRRTSPIIVLGAGATVPLGPGYQFRLEARDVVINLERPTGAADPLAKAPIGSRLYHRFALTMGLDVVLQKQRGRRY